jgi:azurin
VAKAYKGAIYSPEYLFPEGVLVSIPRRERGIAMKSYAMSKLSASFIVLVMALSALVFVLPSENSGQSTSGASIYVPVTSGGTPISNAVVNLTEVHTGAVIAATYSASRTSYVASNPDPGFYRIDVSASNYFNQPGAASVVFTGLRNMTVNQVAMTPFPTKNLVYNITVTASAGGILSGALVGFYSGSHRQFVSTATTSSLGYAVLTMYRTTLITDVNLVIIKSGYETYSAATLVNSNVTTSIALDASIKVSASVQDFNGIPPENVVAYLINTDSSVVWVKRVLRTIGSSFAFDAYPGDFTLIVDAPGNNANVSALSVSAPVALNIALAKQTQRVEHIDMAFGGNFSQFSLAVSTSWSYDDAYPGLMYNDMGSLRAQIDLVMGDGNGILDGAEVTDFNTMLATHGTQYVTSQNLLVVNKTEFTNATATGLALSLTAGAVTSTDAVDYSYNCTYTAHGTIADKGSAYILNSTARLNNPGVDYNYSVSLIAGYELVLNVTPTGGVVRGYKNVTFDSNVTGTGSELIQLTVEKSKPPTAVATLELPSQNASSVLNRTKTPNHLLRYLVKTNGNVTFNAGNSSDPNGNPLIYIWNFTDGTVITTMNKSVVHMFTSSYDNATVNLTVLDMGGLEGYTQMNITSDDKNPTPVISAKAGKVVAKDNKISVNQSDAITFNATYSLDDAVIDNDNRGVIDHFNFSYGDKNDSLTVSWSNSQKNVTHSYPSAGVYVVVLKVTDVVGHNNTTTLTVTVNDTASPTVKFREWNSTEGTDFVENDTIRFDANATRDNVDNYTAMDYNWSFGDHKWQNGTGLYNVTHNYTKIGQFIVTLKVTDLNHNNASSTFTIQVRSGPRPNLIISKVYYDPQNFTQGQTGWILVNITNSGNAVANNVLIQFYIVPDNGGPLVKIGETSSFLNGTTVVTTVQPGGKVQVRFAYNPSSTGTITIKVNVTSADQLGTNSYTASGSQALHVNEAPWHAWLLWVSVIVVIVAIPSLLYVRSRWMKREKKGPRRERKEKESKEKESKEEEEL